MGWVQRVFRTSEPRRGQKAQAASRATGRSWVSPQFLGLVVGLGLLSAGAYTWAQSGQGPGGLGDSPAAARNGGADGGPLLTAYVGFEDLGELQAATEMAGCNLDCRVLKAWYDWLSAHPDAVVVERTPVYEGGILLGYRVEYRENQE